jgi:hypothetical protein
MPGEPLAIELQPIIRTAITHVKHMDRPLSFFSRVPQTDFGNLDFAPVFPAEPDGPARVEPAAECADDLDALVQKDLIVHQKILVKLLRETFFDCSPVP